MKSWIALAFVAVVVAIGGYFAWNMFDSSGGKAPTNNTPYVVPALTKSYSNATHNFSLMTPGDFEAQELPADENGAETVTLQNALGDGVQITITAFDEDIMDLTLERVQADVPDLKLTDVQRVDIGESRHGLAFKSDNAAFGGASREVWFVFRGTLYQISTYERLDPLLQAIFQTWKFL